MFDIGFFELSLIGVVALVVIGPERLPAVARSAGKWVGRANRFISNIKEDISKEVKSEELQSILEQQQKLADEFKKATDSTSSTLNKLNSSTVMDDLLEIKEVDKTEKKKKKKKKKKALKAAESTPTESITAATETKLEAKLKTTVETSTVNSTSTTDNSNTSNPNSAGSDQSTIKT